MHASPQSEPFQLKVTEHQSNLIIAVSPLKILKIREIKLVGQYNL